MAAYSFALNAASYPVNKPFFKKIGLIGCNNCSALLIPLCDDYFFALLRHQLPILSLMLELFRLTQTIKMQYLTADRMVCIMSLRFQKLK
jgi:hypothetical protein